MTDVVTSSPALIRTPDQRLRVFVSSTLEELAPERAAVRRAIEDLHLTPVMFELGARPHAPRNLYRAYLDQSDVFVGVYWQRYGWVAPGEELSGLEDEYARSAGMPSLLYVREPASAREPRLTGLIERFIDEERASFRRFADPHELAELVRDDLVVLLTERFVSSSGAAGRGASASAVPSRSSAPRPATATLGRDDAVDEVVRLLAGERARLVTATGPGGVGKSRLALEVVGRLGQAFPGGIAFVPLEPVDDERVVLPVIADRLGVTGEGARPLPDLLAEHLAGRRILLLLDNFEQVTGAAPEVAALLDRCPDLQLLVTSRRPLRLRGERELPVPPLPVPDAANDTRASAAVDLFIERATAVRPGLHLDEAELRAVRTLVRRLDGLPLAIELAAARVRLLPPTAILERLTERLELLSGGTVDLPDRHRTLHATVGWSYRLLEPDEQRLLDRLSVFTDGIDLDAADAVVGDPDGGTDVLEGLSSLLEHSLLTTSATGSEPRLALLHTIRAYAAERLRARGEADLIAERHADWFLQRAGMVNVLSDTAGFAHFDQLVAESEDIRTAMEWVVERGDVERTAAFAGATWPWFWLRGRLSEVLGWFEAAGRLAEDADATASDRAVILHALGQVRSILGDLDGCIEVSASALRLFEEVGDELGAAGVRIAISSALPHLGRVSEALQLAQEAREVGERRDQPHLLGYATAMIGTAQATLGDLRAAREAHHVSRDAGRRIGLRSLEAQAEIQLAMVDLLEGLLDAAWRRLCAVAPLVRAAGSRETLSYWLEFAAPVLHGRGDAAAAARAQVAAARLRDQLGFVIWPLMEPLHRAWRADVAAALAGADEPDPSDDDPWELLGELAGA